MTVRVFAVLACALVPTHDAAGAPRPTTDLREEQVRVAALIRALSDGDATAAAKLKTLSPAAVLPAVLDEWERLQADPGVAFDSAFGGGGFQEPRTPAARTARTLCRIWFAQIDCPGGEPLARCGAALVDLLPTASTYFRARLVIQALDRNFVPQAEVPLAALLKDRNYREHRNVAWLLVKHRTQAHADAVIDVVADPKVSAEARHWYLMAFCGPPVRALDVPTRKRLVAAGFALLAENQSLQTANHLSGFMNVRFDRANGFLAVGGVAAVTLKNTHPFSQKLAVADALAWWAAHKTTYAGQAPPAP